MTSTEQNVESNADLPEVLNPDEHGTLKLALYDERVSDCDGIEMPDPSS
ncbi:hypothetical protein [Halorussus pelagicus]|nr:hypothetical protein [Halorussus pelagicus]